MPTLRAEVASGRTTAASLAAAYYDRIAQINPRLNVYLSLTKERALAQAATSTRWPPRAIRCRRSPAFPSASKTCS